MQVEFTKYVPELQAKQFELDVQLLQFAWHETHEEFED
jgi:hypothetical protein